MKELLTSLFGWSMKAIKPEETAKLEQLLLEQLSPVAPNPAYVNNLGKRLSYQAEPIIIQGRSRTEEIGVWQALLLIAAGVISGILLVLFGVKIIASIFESRQTRQEV